MLSKSTYIFLIFISVVIIITFSFKNSCVIEGNTNPDANESLQDKMSNITTTLQNIANTFDNRRTSETSLSDFSSGYLKEIETILTNVGIGGTLSDDDKAAIESKIMLIYKDLVQVYIDADSIMSLHNSELAAKQDELNDIIAGYEAANEVTKELVDDETERLKQDQVGNSRLVRNTQYYAKRYADLVFLVKCIILFSIFMIILIYFSSMGLLFDFISEIGIPFIFAVGLFGIWMMYVDIQRRNHYNYDEYNWNFIPPKTETSS
jgi:hypothetical protein